MASASEQRIKAEDWCGVRQVELNRFVDDLRAGNGSKGIVLREDLRRAFRQFVKSAPASQRRHLRRTLGRCIDRAEEMIFCRESSCLVLREEPGRRRAFLLHPKPSANGNGAGLELLDEKRYLSLRESMILDRPVPEEFMFGIDFRPFRIIPTEAGSREDIGEGPHRLAAKLRDEFHADPQRTLGRLIAFLSGRRANGAPLFFTEAPAGPSQLRRRLDQALDFLASRPAREDIARLQPDLALFGLASGWGKTAGRARETLTLLADFLKNPEDEVLMALCQRLPLLRRVLLISVHGWFAQSGVLGRPDTGGQVVYILDQARALEKELKRQWAEAGIKLKPEILILTRLIPESEGTSCGRRREKVRGTENAYILRVPFREPDGSVLPRWISRFQVWPYLERFAHEAYGEIMSELGGAEPDLVVGNYSDGNLVASVLGREWDVPIAVIAHALEKMKYLLSDIYWDGFEPEYHFSVHYLSDILTMNSADFIQVSSYQEIAGTPGELGQYESYELFTLPGRYRVINGVNIQSARFVINPPGTDTGIYHPYTEDREGDAAAEREIDALVRGKRGAPGVTGRLADPGKPPLFTMARLDRIKNLTGLVQGYAKRQALREAFNLIIVSGETRLERSEDHEERDQITRMHRLLEQHGLGDCVCWIPAELGQGKFPHYYRYCARRRGIFVQPALFEAFGLTVLESMACGLPVIATCFGGPAYILEDGVSGFLFDPNRPAELEKAALALRNGHEAEGKGPLWDAVSHAGLRRIHEHFSWPGHARRLTTSHALYGLWTGLFPERRRVRRSYVDALHHLLYRRLVEESWPDKA